MPNPQLIEQIRARINESSEAQINQLIDEARQEAFAEAKAILKDQILQAFLKGAMIEAQQMRQRRSPSPTPQVVHTPAVPSMLSPAPSPAPPAPAPPPPQAAPAQPQLAEPQPAQPVEPEPQAESQPASVNPLMQMQTDVSFDFS